MNSLSKKILRLISWIIVVCFTATSILTSNPTSSYAVVQETIREDDKALIDALARKIEEKEDEPYLHRKLAKELITAESLGLAPVEVAVEKAAIKRKVVPVKALIADFDGTLVSHTGVVESLLKDNLEALLSQGMPIAIITQEREEQLKRRLWDPIEPSLRKNLYIFSNGGTSGFTFNEKGKPVKLFKQTLDRKTRNQILDIVKKTLPKGSYKVVRKDYKVQLRFDGWEKRRAIAPALRKAFHQKGLDATFSYQGNRNLNIAVFSKVEAARYFSENVLKPRGISVEDALVLADSIQGYGTDRALFQALDTSTRINVGRKSLSMIDPDVVQIPKGGPWTGKRILTQIINNDGYLDLSDIDALAKIDGQLVTAASLGEGWNEDPVINDILRKAIAEAEEVTGVKYHPNYDFFLADGMAQNIAEGGNRDDEFLAGEWKEWFLSENRIDFMAEPVPNIAADVMELLGDLLGKSAYMAPGLEALPSEIVMRKSYEDEGRIVADNMEIAYVDEVDSDFVNYLLSFLHARKPLSRLEIHEEWHKWFSGTTRKERLKIEAASLGATEISEKYIMAIAETLLRTAEYKQPNSYSRIAAELKKEGIGNLDYHLMLIAKNGYKATQFSKEMPFTIRVLSGLITIWKHVRASKDFSSTLFERQIKALKYPEKIESFTTQMFKSRFDTPIASRVLGDYFKNPKKFQPQIQTIKQYLNIYCWPRITDVEERKVFLANFNKIFDRAHGQTAFAEHVRNNSLFLQDHLKDVHILTRRIDALTTLEMDKRIDLLRAMPESDELTAGKSLGEEGIDFSMLLPGEDISTKYGLVMELNATDQFYGVAELKVGDIRTLSAKVVGDRIVSIEQPKAERTIAFRVRQWDKETYGDVLAEKVVDKDFYLKERAILGVGIIADQVLRVMTEALNTGTPEDAVKAAEVFGASLGDKEIKKISYDHFQELFSHPVYQRRMGTLKRFYGNLLPKAREIFLYPDVFLVFLGFKSAYISPIKTGENIRPLKDELMNQLEAKMTLGLFLTGPYIIDFYRFFQRIKKEGKFLVENEVISSEELDFLLNNYRTADYKRTIAFMGNLFERFIPNVPGRAEMHGFLLGYPKQDLQYAKRVVGKKKGKPKILKNDYDLSFISKGDPESKILLNVWDFALQHGYSMFSKEPDFEERMKPGPLSVYREKSSGASLGAAELEIPDIQLTDSEIERYFGKPVLDDAKADGRTFVIRKLDPENDLVFIERWSSEFKKDKEWREAWKKRRKGRTEILPHFSKLEPEYSSFGLISKTEKGERLEGYVSLESDKVGVEHETGEFIYQITIPRIELYYRNIGVTADLPNTSDLLFDFLQKTMSESNLLLKGVSLYALTPGSEKLADRRQMVDLGSKEFVLPEAILDQTYWLYRLGELFNNEIEGKSLGRDDQELVILEIENHILKNLEGEKRDYAWEYLKQKELQKYYLQARKKNVLLYVTRPLDFSTDEARERTISYFDKVIEAVNNIPDEILLKAARPVPLEIKKIEQKSVGGEADISETFAGARLAMTQFLTEPQIEGTGSALDLQGVFDGKQIQRTVVHELIGHELVTGWKEGRQLIMPRDDWLDIAKISGVKSVVILDERAKEAIVMDKTMFASSTPLAELPEEEGAFIQNIRNLFTHPLAYFQDLNEMVAFSVQNDDLKIGGRNPNHELEKIRNVLKRNLFRAEEPLVFDKNLYKGYAFNGSEWDLYFIRKDGDEWVEAEKETVLKEIANIVTKDFTLQDMRDFHMSYYLEYDTFQKDIEATVIFQPVYNQTKRQLSEILGDEKSEQQALYELNLLAMERIKVEARSLGLVIPEILRDGKRYRLKPWDARKEKGFYRPGKEYRLTKKLRKMGLPVPDVIYSNARLFIEVVDHHYSLVEFLKVRAQDAEGTDRPTEYLSVLLGETAGLIDTFHDQGVFHGDFVPRHVLIKELEDGSYLLHLIDYDHQTEIKEVLTQKDRIEDLWRFLGALESHLESYWNLEMEEIEPLKRGFLTQYGGEGFYKAYQEYVTADSLGKGLHDLDEVVENLKVPGSMERGIKEGYGKKLFDPERKQKVYAETRRIFQDSGIQQILRDLGIQSYVLFVVSGMSPDRVAVRDHSDLDLSLSVALDPLEENPHAKFKSIKDALKNIKGLTFIKTTDIFPFETVVRFETNETLENLGVHQTVDLNLELLRPVKHVYYDVLTHVEKLYELSTPIEILLADNFDLENERRTILSFLLSPDNPSHLYSDIGLIEKRFWGLWLERLARDYYHLRVAGVDVSVEEKELPDFEDYQNILKTILENYLSVWEQFENDLYKFYEDHQRFLKDRGAVETRELSPMHVAHREVGNYKTLQDRLLIRQEQGKLNEKTVERALSYYEDRMAELKTVGALIADIRRNPQIDFGALSGSLIFNLFTDSPKTIETEMGIPRSLLVLGLLIDLLESRREVTGSFARYDLLIPQISLTDEEIIEYFGKDQAKKASEEGRTFTLRQLNPDRDMKFIDEWKKRFDADRQWQEASKSWNDGFVDERPHFRYLEPLSIGLITKKGDEETLEGFIGFQPVPVGFEPSLSEFTYTLMVPQLEPYYRNLGDRPDLVNVMKLLFNYLIKTAKESDLILQNILLHDVTPDHAAIADGMRMATLEDDSRALAAGAFNAIYEQNRLNDLFNQRIAGRSLGETEIINVRKMVEETIEGSSKRGKEIDWKVDSTVPEEIEVGFDIVNFYISTLEELVDNLIAEEPVGSTLDVKMENNELIIVASDKGPGIRYEDLKEKLLEQTRKGNVVEMRGMPFIVSAYALTASKRPPLSEEEVMNFINTREKDLPFIFGLTTGDRGHRGGAGLTLVRSNAAFLGGSVDYTTGPEGTTFTVRLPIVGESLGTVLNLREEIEVKAAKIKPEGLVVEVDSSVPRKLGIGYGLEGEFKYVISVLIENIADKKPARSKLSLRMEENDLVINASHKGKGIQYKKLRESLLAAAKEGWVRKRDGMPYIARIGPADRLMSEKDVLEWIETQEKDLPFVSGLSSREQGGGPSLSTLKIIVNRLNGDLIYEPIGKGGIFTVRLPTQGASLGREEFGPIWFDDPDISRMIEEAIRQAEEETGTYYRTNFDYLVGEELASLIAGGDRYDHEYLVEFWKSWFRHEARMDYGVMPIDSQAADQIMEAVGEIKMMIRTAEELESIPEKEKWREVIQKEQDKVAKELQVLQNPEVDIYWTNYLIGMFEMGRPLTRREIIEEWKGWFKGKARRKKIELTAKSLGEEDEYKLDEIVGYVIDLFHAEPERTFLPTAKELETFLPADRKTISEHFPDIIQALRREILKPLIEPKLENRISQAITVWEKREEVDAEGVPRAELSFDGVIIAEDDMNFQQLIELHFMKHELPVLGVFSDGQSALRFYKTYRMENPEARLLIFTDMTMPLMTGMQLAMKIRSEYSFADDVIILNSDMDEKSAKPYKGMAIPTEKGKLKLFDMVLPEKIKKFSAADLTEWENLVQGASLGAYKKLLHEVILIESIIRAASDMDERGEEYDPSILRFQLKKLAEGINTRLFYRSKGVITEDVTPENMTYEADSWKSFIDQLDGLAEFLDDRFEGAIVMLPFNNKKDSLVKYVVRVRRALEEVFPIGLYSRDETGDEIIPINDAEGVSGYLNEIDNALLVLISEKIDRAALTDIHQKVTDIRFLLGEEPIKRSALETIADDVIDVVIGASLGEEIDNQPVDIRQTLDRFRNYAGSSIDISMDPAVPQKVLVFCDDYSTTTALQWIVRELVGNAVQIEPEGIQIKVYTKDEKLFIEVIDKGPGIDFEKLKTALLERVKENRAVLMPSGELRTMPKQKYAEKLLNQNPDARFMKIEEVEDYLAVEKNLKNLVFIQGLSTKEGVREHAMGGQGFYLIKTIIDGVEGSDIDHTTGPAGTTFIASLPFVAVGASLGEVEQLYVTDTLTTLKTPVNVFMSYEDYIAQSKEQREELYTEAGLNPKTLNIIVYEADSYDKPMPNITITTDKAPQAIQLAPKLDNNIHLSKVDKTVMEDFSILKDKTHFFRLQDDQLGLLSVALLLSQAEDKDLFISKYGLKKQNGFFVSVSQFLSSLIQDYHSQIAVAVAA